MAGHRRPVRRLPEIRLHAITRGPSARDPVVPPRRSVAPLLPSRLRYTCDSIWWKIRIARRGAPAAT